MCTCALFPTARRQLRPPPHMSPVCDHLGRRPGGPRGGCRQRRLLRGLRLDEVRRSGLPWQEPDRSLHRAFRHPALATQQLSREDAGPPRGRGVPTRILTSGRQGLWDQGQPSDAASFRYGHDSPHAAQRPAGAERGRRGWHRSSAPRTVARDRSMPRDLPQVKPQIEVVRGRPRPGTGLGSLASRSPRGRYGAPSPPGP